MGAGFLAPSLLPGHFRTLSCLQSDSCHSRCPGGWGWKKLWGLITGSVSPSHFLSKPGRDRHFKRLKLLLFFLTFVWKLQRRGCHHSQCTCDLDLQQPLVTQSLSPAHLLMTIPGPMDSSVSGQLGRLMSFMLA